MQNTNNGSHNMKIQMEPSDERFASEDMSISNANSNGIDKDELATPPAHTTVEDALSTGLLQLSITDRTDMEEEIHGVRCLGTKETPDLLQRSLQEFNRELLSIKNSASRRAALQHSARNSSSFTISSNYRRRASKSNNNINRSSQDAAPIDVLKNVIDTDTINQDQKNTTTTAATKCYLNYPDVRLRFLRCESFDAKAAAKRFVKFFDLAREVFGDFVADRPIRLSDFFQSSSNSNDGGGSGSGSGNNDSRPKRSQKHEKKALANSRIQYLSFRDRSGRRVKVGVGDCNADLDLFLRVKIHLLLDWIASEDVETQQKGVVLVVWPSEPPASTNASPDTMNNYNNPNYINNNSSGASSYGSGSGSETEDKHKWEGLLRPRYSKNVVAYHKRYYDAQPIRVAAMHWCSQDKPIYRVLNALYYFSLDSKSQSRYKVHFGEPLEIRYNLQAFGIPVDLLPLTHSMALKRQNHSQWIACRKYIEEQQQQQEQHQLQQYQQQQLQQQQFQQHFMQQQPWDDEQALEFFESAVSIETNNNNSSSGSGSGSQGCASSCNNGQPIVVECPRSYDVIIGKAKVCTNNPGNGFYSSLIEATHDEHDSLVHARDKVAMTWRIYLHITDELKGHFLDFDKSLNAWVVIQDKVVIRKKIANSYKEYKRSRYVLNRSSNNRSQKKKQAPFPDMPDHETSGGGTMNATNGNNNIAGYTNQPVVSKRRKISGCLGNSEYSESPTRETESMFAGL